ncbi:hypothetical protein PMSD_06735 [Paenibacillus macquariensis subsp. defensor]|nr:hypothetical protein PMSD_06735 [Paenibacillus macquariensis subsp. defensor]
MIDSTGESFKSDIGNNLNLVYFWGPQCSVCRTLKPIIEQLDQEIGEQLNIVSFNLAGNLKTSIKYRIMSVPVLMIFKDGKPVEKLNGFHSKEELHTLVNKYLATSS